MQKTFTFNDCVRKRIKLGIDDRCSSPEVGPLFTRNFDNSFGTGRFSQPDNVGKFLYEEKIPHTIISYNT